jgi:galactonate dehydratase
VRITGVRPVVLGTAWRNLTFVVVSTDEGIDGVGEVRMINNTEALLGYLAEAAPNHVIGADPFAIEALVQRMWHGDYGRPGQIEMSGIAAVEIACWDIVGKALGQPVYRLLGGPVRGRIKAYANGWYTVERTPEQFHEAARRVVEKGYLGLKLDPFGAGSYELSRSELAASVALVEAVRDAIGPDADLFVEMHGRFTPSTAIRVAHALAPFDPGWIEEPVPPENLRALRRSPSRSRFRWRRASASTCATSSGSCSSCRPPTSSSRTRRCPGASRRRASSRRGPRRTTCSWRRTTSAAPFRRLRRSTSARRSRTSRCSSTSTTSRRTT